MTSSFVYFVLDLNQVLNKVQLFLYPFQWCSNEKRWHFSKNIHWKYYFWFTFISKILLGTGSLLGGMSLMSETPTRFGFVNIFTALVSIQALWITFLIDLVSLVHGDNIVLGHYLCHSLEMKHTKNQRRGIDLFGIVLASFTVIETVFPVGFFLIPAYFRTDPYYPYLVWFESDWYALVAIIPIRIIILIGNASFTLVGGRNITMITLTTGLAIFTVQNELAKRNVSFGNIMAYKQLKIQRNVLYDYEVAMCSAAFGSLFWAVVVSVNGFALGVKSGNVGLSACGVTLGLFSLFIIEAMFHVSCTVAEKSVKILNRWEQEPIGLCKPNRSWYRKAIKGCGKGLVIPAGHLGGIDKNYKMGYYSELLDNSVSFLMVVQAMHV